MVGVLYGEYGENDSVFAVDAAYAKIDPLKPNDALPFEIEFDETILAKDGSIFFDALVQSP